MMLVAVGLYLVAVKLELVRLYPALDVVDVLPSKASIAGLLSLWVCVEPLDEVLQGQIYTSEWRTA